MKALLSLAWRSAWNRRFVLLLVALSIALSTLLLLGIERIRQDVRDNFSQAVSGTDLIVGARTGPVQLLLYSVFRIGNATNNLRWASAQALARHPAVAWMVPLSLGDSHRGFAVLGTSGEYFVHFRYGARQALHLAEGRPFGSATAPSDGAASAATAAPAAPAASASLTSDAPAGLYEAVLGSEVAHRLGYRLGQRIVLSHGDGAFAANDHADQPFTVVGVLAPTGTPVDRTVHINLASMQAIHLDWMAGAPLPGRKLGADEAARQDLTPRTITAALLGLRSRAAVFAVQRDVASFRDEPLMAILPGVALDELWEVIGVGERGLLAMSALVSAVSLAGLVAVILAGLNERRRELAILRAVGAGPRQVLALLALEGALVTLGGVLLGGVAGAAALMLAGDWVQARFGIALSLAAPSSAEWQWVGAVLAGGWLASLVPGWRAYRLSLADGLSPRI